MLSFLAGKLQEKYVRMRFNMYGCLFAHLAQRWGSLVCEQKILFHRLFVCVCVCVCIHHDVSVSVPAYALFNMLTESLTCSLMLLIPSGPSRFTACFTRSVRPQLSIRKPKSCRNFASVEAASSFLEAQKQSSVLKGKAHKVIHSEC